MKEKGAWIPIIEYSRLRGVSVSTIRRYIKAKKVHFKKDGGRYLIYLSAEGYVKFNLKRKNENYDKVEIGRLTKIIRSLKEENDELKMLVVLYESKLQLGDCREGKKSQNIQFNRLNQ